LAKNPKNGAVSIPLKRPIRVRLGGCKKDSGLRAPFGGPKSFDPSKVDRVSFSVCVDPAGAEAEFANKVDVAVKQALSAKLSEYTQSMTSKQMEEKWKSWLKPAKEDYNPTISVKVQKTGRPCRIWKACCPDQPFEERKKLTWEEADELDWKISKVAVIAEIRSIWMQPHQLGLTVDATEILIFPEDDACGFSESDSE